MGRQLKERPILTKYGIRQEVLKTDPQSGYVNQHKHSNQKYQYQDQVTNKGRGLQMTQKKYGALIFQKIPSNTLDFCQKYV